MKKPFIDQWLKQIKTIFPESARIGNDHQESDAIIKIDWKLENDLDRPNKRSRLIKIIISGEAIEDCQNPVEAGKIFHKIIKEKFSSFDPDHDDSIHTGPPEEVWVISTFDLN